MNNISLRFCIRMNDKWLNGLEKFPGLSRNGPQGSFAVQFGGHLRYGDHLRAGIICGPVQSFTVNWLVEIG